jgi:hypothetical protein
MRGIMKSNSFSFNFTNQVNVVIFFNIIVIQNSSLAKHENNLIKLNLETLRVRYYVIPPQYN